jgi:phage baseplate assembly protein W
MATLNANITKRFIDLDLNFNSHPIKKDVTKVMDEMAVINSIKNLLLTNHYERPFQPDLGSNVRKLLFDNMDQITASALERQITDTLRNFEPRAQITYMNILPDFDNNSYSVSMEFRIINKTEPISIQFFLQRSR